MRDHPKLPESAIMIYKKANTGLLAIGFDNCFAKSELELCPY